MSFYKSFESYIPNTATLPERTDLMGCFTHFMDNGASTNLDLFQLNGVESLLYETLYNAFHQHSYLYKQIICLFGDWRDIKFNPFFNMTHTKQHILLDWVFGFVDARKLLKLNHYFDLPVDFVDSDFFLKNSYKVFNKFDVNEP